MATVYAPHKIERGKYGEHLDEVRADMERLGAPTLRAIWHEGQGVWLAIEGSHRLAIAHELGLTPVIHALNWSDEIEHDLQDYPSPCRVQDLEEWITDFRRLSRETVSYSFGDLARGSEPAGWVEE